MLNLYKQFIHLYPKDIKIETLVFIIHIFRKTLLNTGREMGDTSLAGGGTILMLTCILLNIWIIIKNNNILINSIKETKWFLYYTIFCLFSIFWSITGYAGFTSITAKGLETLTSFLALSIVLYKIKDVNRCVIYILYITTIAALSGRIAQGFLHTNSYSVSGMIGFIISLGLKRKYNPKYINYFTFLNLFCLIMGTSSGSYISTICALLILLSTNKKGINIALAIFIVLTSYLIYKFAADTIYNLIFYGHSTESIEGGTGRYKIWEQFIEGWKASPWLGYGYIVGERNLALMGGMENIFSAHNGYLSILVNTGIIGSLIFSIFLLKTLFSGLSKVQTKNVAQPLAAVFFAVFCGILVNNLSYPLLGSDWNHTFLPMMSILIMMNTWKNKVPETSMTYILTKKAWKQ